MQLLNAHIAASSSPVNGGGPRWGAASKERLTLKQTVHHRAQILRAGRIDVALRR